MATGIYLTVTGTTQGKIVGSCTQTGREETVEIHSYSQTVSSPRDETSGRVIGKRQHSGIALVAPVDKATPLFLLALTTNEILSEALLQFYHTTAEGMEVIFYTVTLTNASFSSVTIAADGHGSFDTVAYVLNYQKVEWMWTDGNVSATDDWMTPV